MITSVFRPEIKPPPDARQRWSPHAIGRILLAWAERGGRLRLDVALEALRLLGIDDDAALLAVDILAGEMLLEIRNRVGRLVEIVPARKGGAG
jgi:hypothetical protein